MSRNKKLTLYIGSPEFETSSTSGAPCTMRNVGGHQYGGFARKQKNTILPLESSKCLFVWNEHQPAHKNAKLGALEARQCIEMVPIQDIDANQIFACRSLWNLDERKVKRIAEFFFSEFAKIKIIGYIHPPQSYLSSALQHLINKHGRDHVDLSDIYPAYRNKIEKFDRIFGRQNVNLKPFESDMLFEGDVVQDFCRQVGETIDRSQVIRVNETLSLEATALLFVFNRHRARIQNHAQMDRDREELAKAIRPLGRRQFRLSSTLVAPILSKHDSDIRWLEDRLDYHFAHASSDDEDAVESVEQLETVALTQLDELDAALDRLAQEHESTPEQLAHVIEKFRIFLTGRSSQGVAPSSPSEPLFTRDQLDRMGGPAAALREFAIVLAKNGHKLAALNVINRAIDLRPDADGLRALRNRWMQ